MNRTKCCGKYEKRIKNPEKLNRFYLWNFTQSSIIVPNDIFL
ncbi:hypothetical protein SUBVAR_05437 [Subdoligranulum variabile DSM 15176]|uniref:Uncharacterized protein n=1 Tax=Subdoligranulum variabile DSM 15176 TaxID=411471 RepID=D1PM78_9FIRM|nr:hypothetical protein SUBVAR_05437 [Subdoligranulum variabile DSM 15176]